MSYQLTLQMEAEATVADLHQPHLDLVALATEVKGARRKGPVTNKFSAQTDSLKAAEMWSRALSQCSYTLKSSLQASW